MKVEKKNTIHIFQVISFAGAFCAFCIGSGFATGQEIQQFFTSHGLASLGALAISMVLFMWFAATIMVQGQREKFKVNTDIFEYNCGKVLGTFFEYFVPVFLFMVVVIMFAGASATIQQYFGAVQTVIVDGKETQISSIPVYIHNGVMPLCAMFSVLFGLRRLIQIIGTIGPIIIIIALFIGTIGIINSHNSLSDVPELIQQIPIKQATSNWAVSGYLYAIFMILTTAPFISSVGAQAQSQKDALLGGMLGGFAYVAAAAVLNIALLCNLLQTAGLQVPALGLAEHSSKWFADVFVVVLMLGIYTTAAPVLWSVCNRLAADDHPYFKPTVLGLTVLAVTCSSVFNFGTLVGTIYPYTGYLGTLFAICVLVKQITGKKLP